MTPVTGKHSVTERLAGLLARPISQADRACAALHLVDWLGCAFIGRTTEPGRILSSGRRNHGLPLFVPDAEPAGTAFALGGLGSILEMDDVHRTALLHPGPVVIPAVLSFGDEVATETFLDAIIAGYEAMIRIGAAVGRAHYAFFHNTATCGGFGAAAAAGRMIGLETGQLVSALGTAGSVAGGLWQCRNEPVMTKAFHVAEAARRGVAAAQLAAQGLTGPRFILEGPGGFFAAIARDGSSDAIIADPDAHWRIGETSFKPWPACRHAHAAIDAALLVRDAIGADQVPAIESISVTAYADAITFCDRPEPKTAHEAKFSLQHAVAVALARGRPSLDDFDPANLERGHFPALRRKVTVGTADIFTKDYPRHFGSEVSVTLGDGTVVVREVHDAWGDPENPMDEDAVIAKCRMLMEAAGIDPASALRAIDAALSLGTGAPLSDLARALAAIRESA